MEALKGRLEFEWSVTDKGRPQVRRSMPTLIRFIVILCLIAAVVYGSMIALVVFVEPNQREMDVRIPNERIAR